MIARARNQFMGSLVQILSKDMMECADVSVLAAVEQSSHRNPEGSEQRRQPVGPLVYRRRLRAALEAEIGRLYLDTLEKPVPPRWLSLLRGKAST